MLKYKKKKKKELPVQSIVMDVPSFPSSRPRSGHDIPSTHLPAKGPPAPSNRVVVAAVELCHVFISRPVAENKGNE